MMNATAVPAPDTTRRTIPTATADAVTTAPVAVRAGDRRRVATHPASSPTAKGQTVEKKPPTVSPWWCDARPIRTNAVTATASRIRVARFTPPRYGGGSLWRARAPVGQTPTVTPDLHFRDARPADVAAVVDLVESAYRGESSRAGWTTEAHLLDGQRTDFDEVVSMIARIDSAVVLAERDGELLGCCHLERRKFASAYFGMFAVRPVLQGAGIGRALVAEAQRRAADWGCEQMRMTVIRQRDDLLAWYGRLGFSPTGETEPFPYGDERFGRPRRADLEFVVLAGPVRRPAADALPEAGGVPDERAI